MGETTLAFVDTETTGLDPDLHEIWEVGLILRDNDGVEVERLWQLPVDLGKADAMALKIGRWYDRRWPWPVYESPYLSIREEVDDKREEAAVQGLGEQYVVPWARMAEWAALFAELTDGAHLVGAVVSFDEERLRRLLRRHKACPTWHYHLIDVEALAAGWAMADSARLAEDVERREADPDLSDVQKLMGVAGPSWRRATATPPWNSDELSKVVGVYPEQFDRHTALGDAKWAKAIYDAVMGGPHGRTAPTSRSADGCDR